jgi:hypothetical protein
MFHEHSSVGRDIALNMKMVGVRTLVIPLIHLRVKFGVSKKLQNIIKRQIKVTT